MRIVVFGASSRVGLYVVKEALEREHRVAVFTRRPEAFPLGHPKLDVVGGDVLAAAAVARALSGAHGVICALGASRRRADAAVHSRGMENIIRAMDAAGCQRVAWLSSAGCSGRGFRRILGGYRSSARENELECLRASGLEWILVRAPRFREGAGPGPVRAYGDGRAGKYIYLADLAAFLVEELERGLHIRKLVAVFSA